jgi:putative hydrolase of the HAD superfamily
VSTAAPRRAVIFDLDDTLILEAESTMAALRAAAAHAHDRAGLDAARFVDAAAEAAERLWKDAPGHAADGEAFGVWWGEALWGDFAGGGEVPRAMRAFVPGFRAAVWRDALAAAGKDDAALGDALRATYIRARRSRETIDPDAESVLADLARDHRLALLTNGAADVQREKISRTALGRHFATIVISGEAGVGKPDPRVFEIVLERLGVAKDAATMVGDSLPRDIGGAQGSGLRAIWLDRGQKRDGVPVPDATIRRLSDLRAALDALERRPASPRATT